MSTIRNRSAATRVTFAGFVFSPPMRTPFRHHLEEIAGDVGLDRHEVFLFVPVLLAQHLVDDVAVVGEQDEALGFLVEAADGEDPLGWPTKSTMLPGTPRSVVDVMPAGLWSAM